MAQFQLPYSPVTCAVLAAVLILGYTVYRAGLPTPLPGIPYHTKAAKRWLGQAPDMMAHMQTSGNLFEWLNAQGAELDSPVFQLFMRPFCPPDVFLVDPQESQDILLRRAKDFDRSRFFMDCFKGALPYHHIVQPTNDKFRQGRRLLADTMTTGFLNNVAAPCLHRHILNLMELWRVKNRAADGHAFACAEDVSHMALDSIWDVAFGSELSSLPDETSFLERIDQFPKPASKDAPIVLPKPVFSEVVRSMKTITSGIDVAVVSPLPRVAHWFLSWKPSYRRAAAYRARLVQERLDDAKYRLVDHNKGGEDGSGGGEFAGITCATDHLVRRETQAAAKEGRAPRYDAAEAKDELFGFLIAGHDTTATTLSWAVKLLADSPRVQEKLRGILRDTFGDVEGVPGPEDIVKGQIPYLDAVIEEVVRCAQTSGAIIRRAVHDTEVLGYRIPKGVDVYMLSTGPGYFASNAVNETILESARSVSSQESKDRAVPKWDEGDITAFKPERWIKTDEKGVETYDGHAGPVLQFGGGLRGCFGKKLAYLEMRTMIVLLIWSFELKQVAEGLRGYEAVDVLTHKPRKCYLRLEELPMRGSR